MGNVDIGAFESRGFRLAIASGNNQSVAINTAFASPLSVTVTANGAGEPVSGGQVTFTPPVSGASCSVVGTPATISGSTATTRIVTANATAGGPYSVVVNARGVTNISNVNFSLTNLPLSTLSSVGARTTGQLRGRKTTVASDYDGDGKADVAVFRRAANWGSYWHIRRSSDGAVVEKQWGLETDTPVPADYDGDGQADIAVWREADANWHIIKSSDQQSQIIGVGSRTDRESDTPVSVNSVSSHGAVPVPADYDGDGKTDIAVWRTVDGTWHIRRSGDQHLLIKTHGQSGDTPVTIPRPRP